MRSAAALANSGDTAHYAELHLLSTVTEHMPVLGHAFVGLAVGSWTHPNTHSAGVLGWRAVGRALWTPLIVGLSYFPDILAQVGLFLVGRDLRQITHAAPIAVVLALDNDTIVQEFDRADLFVARFFSYSSVFFSMTCWTYSRRPTATSGGRCLYSAVGPEEPLIPTSPNKKSQCSAVRIFHRLLPTGRLRSSILRKVSVSRTPPRSHRCSRG